MNTSRLLMAPSSATRSVAASSVSCRLSAAAASIMVRSLEETATFWMSAAWASSARRAWGQSLSSAADAARTIFRAWVRRVTSETLPLSDLRLRGPA
eukprot:gene32738-biopygen21148